MAQVRGRSGGFRPDAAERWSVGKDRPVTLRRGITLLDLLQDIAADALTLTNPVETVLPEWLMRGLERLVVLDQTSITAGDVIVRRGKVQALSTAVFNAPLSDEPFVEVPGVNRHLRFQFTVWRTPPAAGQNVEPNYNGWKLDLHFDRVSIDLSRPFGLVAARRVEGSGTTPAHLVADPQRSGVRLVGSAVIGIGNPPGAGGVQFHAAQAPDPLDPDEPSGLTVGLRLDPPHALIGASGFGLTVDRLLIDFSTAHSPDEIVSLNLGDAWRGVLLREATLYLPPSSTLLGPAASIGVRDLRIGRPGGVQGELQLEFGLPQSAPGQLLFEQRLALTGEVSLGGDAVEVPDPTKPRMLRVHYVAEPQQPRREFRVTSQVVGARIAFRLPDGRLLDGPTSGWFEAAHGSQLEVWSVSGDGEDLTASLPYCFQFEEGQRPERPLIDLSWQDPTGPHANVPAEGHGFEDVLFVSGRRERLLGALRLTARMSPEAMPPDTWSFQWRGGVEPGAQRAIGLHFVPDLPLAPQQLDVLLIAPSGRQRRLRIEVVEAGPVVVGLRNGAKMIVESPGAPAAHNGVEPLSVRAFEGVFDAGPFHLEGKTESYGGGPPPWVHPDTGAVMDMPAGSLAEVTLALGHGDDVQGTPPDVQPGQVVRHLQVLMDYNTADDSRWGLARLARPYSRAAVQQWADQFGEAARFVVIGRTCDQEFQDGAAAALGELRALAGVALLGRPVIENIVFARSELVGPLLPAAQQLEAEAEPAVPTQVVGQTLFDAEKADHAATDLDELRKRYRRVDIWAVGGADSDVAERIRQDEVHVGPALRRALIAGPDLVQLITPPAAEPTRGYRLRLRVRWDNPVFTGAINLVPSLAELLVVWTRQQASDALAQLPFAATAPAAPPSPPLEAYEVLGRWTYDPHGEATRFSLGWRNDGVSGLGEVQSAPLAAVALLGPPLLAGLQHDTPGGMAVRVVTLGALAGAAIAKSVVQGGRVLLHGLEGQVDQQRLGQAAGTQFRLLADYTAEVQIAINTPALTITTTNPLKVRYERVTLEIDPWQPDWRDRFGLSYEGARFDVADPGEWQIGGKIGEVLSVAGTRAGSGSVWFEVDLAFTLDLGPIKITTATVRITLPTQANQPPGVELRGLGASINVPGVIEGKGTLSLTSGGFQSSLFVGIKPLHVDAAATLVVDQDFTYIGVEVKLPTAIPLGPTGLGLFGFIGRFAINGERAIATGGDPVQAEIDWYRAPRNAKYRPRKGRHALGLGVIVGTMPDAGFMVHATGMLSVAFPDPEVVISVDATLASQPKLKADDDAKAPAVNKKLELLGLISVSEQAFLLGVRGQYEIPLLLDLKVPLSGYFPIAANAGWWLRIGSDGVGARSGDPVSATILPGTVDFRCWAWLMLDQIGLPDLGKAAQYGLDPIHLSGFSIGFGAGFEIEREVGPLALSASAVFLCGLGTRPMTLAGAIAVEGELDLGIVSAAVFGRLQGDLRYLKAGAVEQSAYRLKGAVGASVDLGLITLEGSVDFTLSSGPAIPPPLPDPVLVRIDLTDRRGLKTGEALIGGAGATVWPDTVPVLCFGQPVANALPANHAIQPGAPLAGPVWCGSTDRKVAYRLVQLSLLEDGQPFSGPIDSVWWWPTFRGALIDPAQPAPSEHETRALALMSWHPCPLTRSMDQGGAGSPADPAQTLATLCEPPLTAPRNFAPGAGSVADGHGRTVFATPQPTPPPLVNAFTVKTAAHHGGLAWSQAAPLLADQGRLPVAGSVVSLPQALVPAGESQKVTAAWQLPTVREQSSFVTTAQLDALLLPALRAPALTLAVWDRQDRKAKETTVCDGFERVGQSDGLVKPWVRPVGSFSTVEPTQALRALDSDGDGRVELSAAGGIVVVFPKPLARVTVELTQWGGPVTLRAFDSNKQLLAQADSAVIDGLTQTVAVSGAGITQLTLGMALGLRGMRFVLRRLCAVQREALAPIGQPVVQGRREGQSAWETWPAKPIGTAAAPGGGLLSLWRFQPADASAAWRAWRVQAFADAHLLLVGVSGVDAALADLIAANEAAKQAIKDVVGPAAAGDSPKAEKSALLKPGSTYQIVVETEWAMWEKSANQASPPLTLANSVWTSFGKQAFSFQVASEDASEARLQQPVALLDEAVFDPRALSRYLLGLSPDGGMPHFLDDPLSAHFAIDYADALCAAYGRGLTLKLRRTDPPAGSLAGAGADFHSPPDLPIVVFSGPLGYPQIDPHDHWWIDPEIAPPCVPLDGPKGETKTVRCEALEANAEYDLMLVAPPSAAPQSDQVLVARSHFRSSRHANPAALLASLGLAVAPPDLPPNAPLPLHPVRPDDLFLAGPVALPQAPEVGDRALEAALRALGLDPLPLPAAPRVAAIWQPDGVSGHALWGVLVDADEPLHRPDRLRHQSCALQRTGLPDLALTLFRHNASTTRLIYRLAAPVAWTGAGALALTLESLAWVGQNLVATPVTGRRALHGTPRSVAEGAF